MDISYLGHSAFKIKGKTATIITDPFDSGMVGLKFPKSDADIVTVSHNHDDHSQTSLVTGVKRVIEGPGEYEIGGVSFIGIPSFHDNKKGDERGKNTIFVIEIDGLRLCHLGDLGHALNESQLSEIGDIDILFVPVGGQFTIGPKEAVEVANSIEPKVIIPMHYLTDSMNQEAFGALSKVDEFLTEMGLKVERLPRFSIKAGELSSEDVYIVVLETK